MHTERNKQWIKNKIAPENFQEKRHTDLGQVNPKGTALA